MTSAASSDAPGRAYTGFRRPTKWGIHKLGPGGTVIIGFGLVGFVLTMQIGGILAGAVFAALVAAFLGTLVHRDAHNRSGLTRAGVRLGWWRTRRKKAHLYTSGPMGNVPSGRYQLPGILASTKLFDKYSDALERPFALLHLPTRNHFTVVLTAQPNGVNLTDQATINNRVHLWGQWLQNLGNQPGLVGASVTFETSPETGNRLRRTIEADVDDDAHDLCQAMYREIAEEFPEGQAQARAWIALTFAGFAGRKRSPDEVAADLATRLPNLTRSLIETGAGVARPVSADELCRTVREAYDPGAAVEFERRAAAGDPVRLDWADVGPTAAEEQWDRYLHDRGVSTTYAMSQPPAGAVTDRVLQDLLAPDPRVDRKRVTLLLTPHNARDSVKIVDADKENARFRANTARRDARLQAAFDAAVEAAEEQARLGASVVDFALLVTATVFDPERLPDARSAIEAAAATARITLREQFRGQAQAFAACLPLGLKLRSHMKIDAGSNL